MSFDELLITTGWRSGGLVQKPLRKLEYGCLRGAKRPRTRGGCRMLGSRAVSLFLASLLAIGSLGVFIPLAAAADTGSPTPHLYSVRLFVGNTESTQNAPQTVAGNQHFLVKIFGSFEVKSGTPTGDCKALAPSSAPPQGSVISPTLSADMSAFGMGNASVTINPVDWSPSDPTTIQTAQQSYFFNATLDVLLQTQNPPLGADGVPET